MADGYVEDIEEQVDDSRPEERDLAEDAQWKQIQKNTFTRWTNQHLKVAGLQIADLQYDLSDGLKLVGLIEVLGSQHFKYVNKRPTFRTQKLENVTMVMKYLEETEQLRLVNIDSTDIVDCRLKLILGLIWTLILHYSISMPLWEGEDPIAKDAKGKGPSPKQRILSWLNSKMPDKPIKNLTTDWNNGIAIGALVDALAPGLCPDWSDWNPKDALKNAKEAMDLAEKWLDVAQLLKPEEMVDPKIDEKALMTYLSQFPKAKLKEGAPLKPRTNPARVRAYGPGLEKTGNAIKAPARFTVDTFSAGLGKLEIVVLNPKGVTEPCTTEMKPNQTQIYACTYVPTMEGEYRVIIKYAGKEVPNSPFTVPVEGTAGDPTKVTASGPGLERKGNVMGKRTSFNVFLNNAGLGNIECKIKDPQKREEIVKPLVTKQNETTYLVEYTPILAGLHTVDVLFAGRSIPSSPFEVEIGADSGKKVEDNIVPKSKAQTNLAPASKKPEDKPKQGAFEPAYVTGRGIQPKGLRVNEPTEFTVHAEKSGPGKAQVKVVGPAHVNEQVKITPLDNQNYLCQYKPTKIGAYSITVEYGTGQVQKSPFKVDIAGASKLKVIAYGPGLKSGVVNSPAPFTVESNDSIGQLSFNIQGPSDAKITCTDNGDRSAAVQYLPTLPGEYAVHVLCNNEDIKDSPFMAQISDVSTLKFDPTKVKASGPGLETNGVQVNKETHFTVDIKNCGGPVPLKMCCFDKNGTEIPIKTIDNKNSTFTCTYTAKTIGKHTIFITFGEIHITGSPYKINVSGESTSGQVTASGPGLESAVIGKPAVFYIDTKPVGGDTASVTVDITSKDRKKIQFQTKDKDGVREIQYIPIGTTETTYTIQISYKNKPINKSPFTVPISLSTAKGVAYVTGRGVQPKGIRVNEDVSFNVHTENAPANGVVKAKVIGPGGIQETVQIKKISEILHHCQYRPTKVGNYVITVDYANTPVSQSPFKVNVDTHKECRIKAYGPGLEKAIVGIPAPFFVETNNESSQLGFQINGPSEAKIDCQDNGDGSVSAKYLPTKPGEYAVHITANEEDIPGSPFMVMATEQKLPKIDTNKIKIFGPGIEPVGNLSGKITSFTIDPKPVNEKHPVKVECFRDDGSVVPVQVQEKPDGTYSCSYTPMLSKKHSIFISYGEISVPKSPYKVNIGQGATGNVKASGPGLEKAVTKKPTSFTVDTTEVGSQTSALTVDIKTKSGQHVPFSSKVQRPGVCEISYTPTSTANDSLIITINYQGQPIKDSPFNVPVVGIGSEISTGRVYVTGRGVVPNGIRTNEVVTFKVHVDKPSMTDNLKPKIVGPNGIPVNVTTKKLSNDTYECQYSAPKEGNYIITVDFNGKPVEKSPFKVNISPQKLSKIIAYGPGLEGGVENATASFIVNPNGETSKLDFKIQGPKEAKITCKDNGDGTIGVDYLPIQHGEYAIHILANNEDIPHSPYMVDITSADSSIHPEKVKAYGPGLEKSGISVGKPATFTIDATQAGPVKPIAVKCYDAEGKLLSVNMNASTNQIYNCQYTPQKPGKHIIHITYGNIPIKDSPFTTNVEQQEGKEVIAYGPGLTKAEMNIPTTFTVDCTSVNGNVDRVQHTILDDKNRKLLTKVTKIGSGKQDITYTPTQNGVSNLKINITYEGKPIKGSPFTIPVEPKKDKNVSVSGRGIQPVGLRVNEEVDFNVESDVPINSKDLKPKVIGPGGVQDQVKVAQVSPNKLKCTYVPSKVGNYSVITEFEGKPIDKSPYKVDVAPKSQSLVKAFGSGLEGGEAKIPAKFFVETNGETGQIGFEVKGPSEAKLACTDQGNGRIQVEYLPELPGEYSVRVLCNDSDIQHSPFMVPIKPTSLNKCDLSKVKAHGPGIESKELPVNKETDFTVDTKNCGPVAPTVAKCYDKKGSPVPVKVIKPSEGIQTFSYTPKEDGEHVVQVLVDDKEIPNSPFKVTVGSIEGKEIVAYGPGITHAEMNVPTTFTVDCTSVNGNTNKILHSITDENNRKLPTKVKDIAPGKQEVSYTPTTTGVSNLKINITYEGKPIKGSPFTIPVEPKKDKNVSVSGRGVQPVGLRVNEEVDFNVESDVPINSKDLKPKVIGPGGVQDQVKVDQVTPNKLKCTYVPSKVGNYSVITEFEGKPIDKSPYKVDVAPKSQSLVKAFGSGLEGGEAKIPAKFFVETNGETGQIGFEVKGPSEAKLACTDQGNGRIQVEYLPELPGEYSVRVFSNDSDIQHSPFMVPIKPTSLNKCDLSKVKAHGPGIESKELPVNKETNFTVDTKNCGPVAPTVAKCYDKKGSPVPVKVIKPSEGVQTFSYTPKEDGEHVVQVLVDDKEIPNSPFKVSAGSKEGSGIVAYGPGLENAELNIPTFFTVDCTSVNGNTNKIQHSITDENNRKLPTKVKDIAPGKQEVSYTPSITGATSLNINVTYDGKPIKGSPFTIPVEPKKDKNVSVSGRGVQPVGLRVNEEVDFNVESDVPINSKDLKPKVIGPGGVQDQVKMDQVTPNKLKCTYVPSKIGNYSVITEFEGKPVEKSPFKVDVAPKSQSLVKAFGSGLENGEAESPAKFFVETNGETGQIGFEVKGPSEAKLACTDQGNGRIQVEYLPELPGEYSVRVLCNDSDIQHSPFMVPIKPTSLNKCDLNKVKAHGPGIESKELPVHEETNFTVDTKNCGPVAPTVVKCYDKKGSPVPVKVIKPSEGVQTFSYTPKEDGEHVVQVLVDDKEIPNSPFKTNVETQQNEVRVYGPGLKRAELNNPTSFTVDCTSVNGNTNKIQHSITDESNRKLPTTVKNIAPGKQEVSYTPTITGESSLNINVTYDGKPIKGSPFTIPVEPKKDKNVSVSGRGVQPVGLRVNEEVDFNVESDVPINSKDLKPKVIGPGGVQDQVKVDQVTPNKLKCTYVPSKIGNYSVITEFEGKPVEKSPFKIDVAPKSQSLVKAFGSGLENGESESPAKFFVETNGETGQIGFEVKGPSEAKLACTDQGNGRIQVEYLPELPGEYSVRVLCNDSDIQHSPFMVPIKPTSLNKCDLNKVKVHGPGIEPKELPLNKETNFTVDTKNCGPVAPTVAKCYDKHGNCVPIKSVKNPNDSGTFVYKPNNNGEHVVQVLVDNKELPDSPFKVPVGTIQNHDIKSSADNVIAYGPGLKNAEMKSDSPNYFYVDCRSCDEPLSVIPEVEVLDENLKMVPVDIKETTTPGLFNVSYNPHSNPNSQCFYPKITYESNNIPGSPFVVPVKVKTEDVSSPGEIENLKKNVKFQEPQTFQIKLKEDHKSEPFVNITDEKGVPLFPVHLEKVKPNTYQAAYTPSKLGPCIITVLTDGKLVEGTPVQVSVLNNPEEVDNVKVEGLAPIVEMCKPQSFKVLTPNSANISDMVDVEVISPSSKPVKIQKERIPEGTQITFQPEENGPHAVGCWIQDQPIDETPCIIKSVPKKDIPYLSEETPVPSNLSVTEKDGFVDEPCQFLIKNPKNHDANKIDVMVLSPDKKSLLPVQPNKTPEGLLCKFIPEESGPHTLLASINNLPIDGSPAILVIQDKKPTDEIPIKLEQAGVLKSDNPHNALEEAIEEMKKKALETSKWPLSKPDEASSKVKVYGEGLNKVYAKEKATFTIDSKDAPSAPIGVTVEGPGEAVINCSDNGDGTCGVEYEVPIPGLYTINVLYDNVHIPQSPIIVPVFPNENKNLDLSKITASGPGLNPDGVFKDCFAKFTVDTTKIKPTDKPVIKATIESPTGKKTIGIVDTPDNGIYNVKYTPTEEGPHKINVTYENLPIKGSPFIVPSKPGFNAKLVTATGPGLKTCKVNDKAQFVVDLDGAGHGSLGLSIEGPADAEIQCNDNSDGTCLVEYTPQKAGEYDINIKFNDEDICNSPFHVKVVDEVRPDKVKCSAPLKESKLDRPNHFTVDCTEAGEAPMEVTISHPGSGKPDKPATIKQVKDKAPGIFDVCFTPESLGPCLINVKYDNTEIPGSPFKTNVVQPVQTDKVKVLGDGIMPPNGTILASMPAIFQVETKEAGPNPDVNVGLFNPNGEPMPLHIEARPNGLYTCEYQTHEVGDHKISVNVDGEPLPKSPYTITSIPTGEAEKCKIKVQENTIGVNKESVIKIETKDAGKGQITCMVRRIDRKKEGPVEKVTILESIKVEVKEDSDGITSVHYVPKEEGEYLVEVKFGGQTIPNGKFTQRASYKYQEVVNSVIRSQRNQISEVATNAFHNVNFEINTKDVQIDDLKAEVVQPSGGIQKIPIIFDDDDKNKIKVAYQPTERGPHQLQINNLGRPIKGSPFQFFVDTKGEGRVTAYGPGLSSGSTNEVAEFTVITKDAGPGGLSLIIEGPSKTEIKCEDNHDGTFKVTYVPQVPGNYNIIIKFKDQPIAGSPFIAKITGEPIKKSHVAVGNSSEIPLQIPITDMSVLTAELTTPSKKQIPCVIKKMNSGALGVSFTPKEFGEHLVHIYEKGTEIFGSPFKIDVKNEEVGDASKVKVSGSGLERGVANQINEFNIDTAGAGYGSLNISIEGPSKAEIDCKDNEDGTCCVKYLPTEPGNYVINVTYAGKNVNGSPFNVNVKGDKVIPSETQKMELVQEAAQAIQIGSNCEINLKIQDMLIKDLKANVHTPSGFTEPCDIEDFGNGNMKLKFVARESGVHHVSVMHKNRHITGSPFQFTVGSIQPGGPNKVSASGPGLEKGLVDVPNEFTIYTREAGAGNISVIIDGPSKAEMKFQESQDKGSCEVKYLVTKPGDYECSIKFNGEHIANSPFHINVTDDSIKPITSRTISSSFSENTVKEDVSGLISITVRTDENETAKLEATVKTPSGHVEPAFVQQIGNGQHGVKFTPRESGIHMVSVENNKVPVTGSPFRISVGDYKADPGMVHASGEGLSHALVEKKAHFFVNTANAGSGSLNVAIDGPSKVKMNYHETEEGYEFTYVASAPGNYIINIKYGGNFHIVGSPFTAVVEGTQSETTEVEQHSLLEIDASDKRCISQYGERSASNADKVICQGLGLKQAKLNSVNSFFVNASQAGSDILLIGIGGPVRPCEEIVVKHVGNNQFTADYVVKERGTHIIMIRWGEKDIPGSPFIVHVD